MPPDDEPAKRSPGVDPGAPVVAAFGRRATRETHRLLRSNPNDPAHVVGIGASAGGVDALQELLQRFTHDRTAFVVLMHLRPDRESGLTEILARATGHHVVTAADGQVLERDTVYVLPAGIQLTLTDEGALSASALPRTFPRWTIDKFFTSLSELGPAAIGVILSGNGSDGAEGLADIQRRGGATFVQSRETASFPDMPANARLHADHVLSPAEIGDALMMTIGAPRKDDGTT